MANNIARKLNRRGESHSGHFSRPINLVKVFGDDALSAGNRKIECAILAFSRNGSVCDFTQAEIATRYRTSLSTVARTRKKIKQCNAFRRGDKVYEYIFQGEEPEKKEYFIIHDWLYHANFYVEGRERSFRLSDSAIEVLCYIKNWTGAKITCTRNWLAKTLGMSPDTVSRSVRLLETLKLITVTYPEGATRAVNATVRTRFRVNKKALDEKCREVVKTVKSKVQRAKEETERADRDRYYAKRQSAERDRLERLLQQLREDPEFAAAEKALRSLEIEIPKAQYQNNQKRLRELLARRIELNKQRKASLERLGISEQDLEERFVCADCHDTGVRSDRTFCDCWRRRSL